MVLTFVSLGKLLANTLTYLYIYVAWLLVKSFTACCVFIFNCGINGLVGLFHILTFYIDIRYSDIVQFLIFNTDTILM